MARPQARRRANEPAFTPYRQDQHMIRNSHSDVDSMLDGIITSMNDERSQGLRQDFQDLLDGSHNTDRILGRAVRWEDQSDTVQSLRYWSTESIREAVLARYRIACEAMAAAAAFDTAATAVINRMKLVDADSIGDVWASPGKA